MKLSRHQRKPSNTAMAFLLSAALVLTAPLQAFADERSYTAESWESAVFSKITFDETEDFDLREPNAVLTISEKDDQDFEAISSEGGEAMELSETQGDDGGGRLDPEVGAVFVPGPLPLASGTGFAVEGEGVHDEFDTLEEAVAAVNSDDGTTYSITIKKNYTTTTADLQFSAGKQITISSASGEIYTVSSPASGGRHFSLFDCSLNLENVILSGESSQQVGGQAKGGLYLTGSSLRLGQGAQIMHCRGATYAPVCVLDGSEMVIDGGSLIENSSDNAISSGVGGAVYLNDSTLFMSNGVIEGNTARWGGGVYVGIESNFLMTGGAIRGNEALTQEGSGNSTGGGGVHVYVHGTFTMEGGEISGNTSEYMGGGIYVAQGTHPSTEPDDWCRAEIKGGEISGNRAEYGGGVAAQYNGNVVMTGGSVSHNEAIAGGGVTIAAALENDKVTFAMRGGEIVDNHATVRGGGIWMQDAYDHVLTATIGTPDSSTTPLIARNSSDYDGGGIVAESIRGSGNARVIIHSVEMKGNRAAYRGGAIGLAEASSLTMSGGSIGGSDPSDGNVAGVGGAIATYKYGASSTFNSIVANGGTISGNRSEESPSVPHVTGIGGGIYVGDNDVADIDIPLTGHTSSAEGGALFIEATARVNLGAAASIAGNRAETDGGGIYTANYSSYDSLTPFDYQNITSDASTVFENNSAAEAYMPPPIADAYANIKYTRSSISDSVGFLNPINNYDINYVGPPAIAFIRVAYDANGGDGSYEERVLSNEPYTIKSDAETNITREGYVFDGWNESPDGGGRFYPSGEAIMLSQSDVVLYAQWEAVAKPPIGPAGPKPVAGSTSSGSEKLARTGDEALLAFWLLLPCALAGLLGLSAARGGRSDSHFR